MSEKINSEPIKAYFPTLLEYFLCIHMTVAKNNVISTKFILMGCILPPFMLKLTKICKKICCALIFFLKKLINYGATDDQIFTKIFLVVNYYPMSLSFKFCKDPCTHARTRAITAQRVNVARREKLFFFHFYARNNQP